MALLYSKIWSTNDVTSRFNCSNKKALEILDSALSSEWMCEKINTAITEEAEKRGLSEYVDGFFYIKGYNLDDKSEFSGLLVCENDALPDDLPEGIAEDDIFEFGWSQYQLDASIKSGDDTVADYVITGYSCVEKKEL